MLYRMFNPRRTLQALHQRAYRWYMVERMVGASTWAMRAVARGWLVYNLTGSVLALAAVEAVRALVGIFLSPLAGVITDRFEKRLVLCGARIILMLTNIVLAVLILLNALQMWHIIVLTIFEGIAFTLIDPVLQSIMPELVDKETLLSATSLSFVIEWVLNIIGAFAAGLLIDGLGVGSVFVINAVLFAVASLALLQMPKGLKTPSSGSMLRDISAGMRYLAGSPLLIIILGLAFGRLLFMQPFGSFLPAFSETNLGFDAAGLGFLNSVIGIGALFSSLVIASMGDIHNKGKALLVSGIAAAAAVLGLMVTGTTAPFVFVGLIGIFSNMADIFTRTISQVICEANYRGRVASLSMVLTNIVVLSVLPAGALADAYGVAMVVGLLAAIVLVAQLAVAVLVPAIRNLH